MSDLFKRLSKRNKNQFEHSLASLRQCPLLPIIYKFVCLLGPTQFSEALSKIGHPAFKQTVNIKTRANNLL